MINSISSSFTYLSNANDQYAIEPFSSAMPALSQEQELFHQENEVRIQLSQFLDKDKIPLALQVLKWQGLCLKEHELQIQIRQFLNKNKISQTLQNDYADIKQQLDKIPEALKNDYIAIKQQLDKLKIDMPSTPKALIARGVAQKGKALQVALKTLIGLSQRENSLTYVSGDYAHNIWEFQLDSCHSIMKHLRPQDDEEENWIESLFHFTLPHGVVPSIRLNELNASHFHMTADQPMFEPASYQSASREPNLKNYRSAIYESELRFRKIPYDQFIQTTPEEQEEFLKCLLPEDREFFNEIRFDALAQELCFIPKFQSKKQRKAYYKCEQFPWSVVWKDKTEAELLDFRHFRFYISIGRISKEHGPIIPQNLLESKKVNEDEVDLAIQTPWKFVSLKALHKEVYKLETDGKSTERIEWRKIENIRLKPYVERMALLSHAKNYPGWLRLVMQRLDAESELAAALTALFQMLDLHSQNMGLILKLHPDPDYEPFYKMVFRIGNQLSDQTLEQSFEDLFNNYLLNKVTDHTYITCGDELSCEAPQKLMDIPNLKAALEQAQSSISLFDLDCCLAEDNVIIKQRWRLESGNLTEEESIIPLRSTFLQLDWKDQPFRETTLESLINDQQNAQRRDWIYRMDAPIRKRLSAKANQKLDELIRPLLEKPEYTLSYWKRKDIKSDKVIIRELQKQFAKDIANLQGPDKQAKLELWQFLETELSFGKVYHQKHWGEVASYYGQDVYELIDMNPDVELKPGATIKLNNNFTTDKGMWNRLKIAAQLFPRLTWKQRDALFERQARCKEYLQNYQELVRLKDEANPEDQFVGLLNFICQPTTPLSGSKRIYYYDYIKNNEEHFYEDGITRNVLYTHLLNKCVPTYANISKSMYPLLADADELSRDIYDNQWEAGKAIGYYQLSLEKMIELKPESPASLFLQSKIQEYTEAGFHQTWNYRNKVDLFAAPNAQQNVDQQSLDNQANDNTVGPSQIDAKLEEDKVGQENANETNDFVELETSF